MRRGLLKILDKPTFMEKTRSVTSPITPGKPKLLDKVRPFYPLDEQ